MSRRSYKQYCGLARALDLVGERWTLLIVRNLLLGPQRYGDLLRGLPGITTNLLAKRLKEMETAGLIEKIELTPPASAEAYSLTPDGRDLERVVHALGSWGWKRLGKPSADQHTNFDWAMVALKRRYRGGVNLRIQLTVDGRPYGVVLAEDGIDVARGVLEVPDLSIAGAAGAVRKLLFEGSRAGRLDIAGSRRAVKSLQKAMGVG